MATPVAAPAASISSSVATRRIHAYQNHANESRETRFCAISPIALSARTTEHQRRRRESLTRGRAARNAQAPAGLWATSIRISACFHHEQKSPAFPARLLHEYPPQSRLRQYCNHDGYEYQQPLQQPVQCCVAGAGPRAANQPRSRFQYFRDRRLGARSRDGWKGMNSAAFTPRTFSAVASIADGMSTPPATGDSVTRTPFCRRIPAFSRAIAHSPCATSHSV